MIRPVGSAMSPRMPASWRICWTEPRAPDWDIISTEWKRSKELIVTLVTSSVALVQMSTVFWYRSSSVISPRRNCRSISSTSFSPPAMIAALAGGVLMSIAEMVTPALVA